MTLHRWIAIGLAVLALLCLLPIGFIAAAHAHEWYSEKQDPVTRQSCCGGTDCNRYKISHHNLHPRKDGFLITLTLEESMAINPYSMAPVNAFVAYERVQVSEDGDWHICISAQKRDGYTGGIYCLFQPPAI